MRLTHIINESDSACFILSFFYASLLSVSPGCIWVRRDLLYHLHIGVQIFL